MKKVYSSEQGIMTAHVQSLLETSGIECVTRNQYLSGGMGELPLNECWPEVWISHDEDYRCAMEIVHEVINDHPPLDACWQCGCGEKMEGQFSACWSCGTERPD
ncbi:MAG: hypothetical protein A2W28_02670 [Gammaproteobacteria bacterium RBG_16_51_14]|nr:MAG: hypothetical protein A2W28_02670 [Gammaproteobacteria bacterium RBG_16_51_14]